MNENSSISEKLRQFRAWFLRFGGLFRKQRRDRELADEIESNLQLHIEDNLRRGMPQEEARRQAVLKFGGVESAKESYRDRRGIPFLDHLFQDVRYALRTFRRNPIFTLAIVATLALGIGVNVTMFSVVDALLFRMPDHVRAPEQLVDVSLQTSDLGEAGIFDCYPGYLRLAGNSRLLDVAAQSHMQMDFGRGTDAREIQSRMVSYTYFDLLGVQMGESGEPCKSFKGPFHLAIDQQDRIWVSNAFGDHVTRFPASDPTKAETFSAGYSGSGLSVDSQGNVWVANRLGSSLRGLAKFVEVGLVAKTGGNADEALTYKMFEQTGGWEGGSVTVLRPDGSQYPGSPFYGPSLPGPWATAIDGDDNVWVANFAGVSGQFAHLCGARTENCPPGFKTGEPISPPLGYVGGGLQMNTDLAIDPAGNVWVMNNWQEIGACFHRTLRSAFELNAAAMA